jgi:hypothetical protein
VNGKKVVRKDAQGNVVWKVKANGSPDKSPGGTKVALEILWSEQKTVKSKVHDAHTHCSCT